MTSQASKEEREALRHAPAAPTIDRESAWSRGGGGGGHRSQISLPSRPKYTKKAKNGRFRARFGL
jgi:hypothetical protein